MGVGLLWVFMVSHGCNEKIEKVKEKESALEVLEFVQSLRRQREEELKNLRFEVISLRRILKAKADAAVK